MKNKPDSQKLLYLSNVEQDVLNNIQQFFNGEPIDKIRNDIVNLRDTTITESYGELDKEDKWLIIDFFRRISNLVEATHLLISNNSVIATPSPG